jgi:hypothetical protein
MVSMFVRSVIASRAYLRLLDSFPMCVCAWVFAKLETSFVKHKCKRAHEAWVLQWTGGDAHARTGGLSLYNMSPDHNLRLNVYFGF